MIEFGQPLWFWAFALFPVLLALFIRNERQRQVLLQKLVAARLTQNLANTVSPAKRRTRFALLLLGFACIIFSLAQPRWGYSWQERKTRGRDVIIAVDVSRSMLANDLAPNRLTRAKLAAEDLIGQLQGDRVGLIAFAGSSFLQAPLTADHSAVLNSLYELDPDVIPRGGTNIADAIRTAVEAFGKGESDNRALVIFTDGEELDTDGIKAAKEQKEISRIFTVGVGSPEGTIIALPGRAGETEYVKDSQGQIVKSRLDEGRLRTIAEAAGGYYLQLRNAPADMRQLAREGIASMSEKEINAEFARQPIERYQWPLAAGMVLLISSMFIGDRKNPATRRQPQLAKVALWIGALFLAGTLHAETPIELYEQGRYKEAQEAYEELLHRNPNSDRLAFNHGAAAYKNKDFKTALESFGKALATEDRDLRARAEYNLGNTLFQQGTSSKGGPDIKTLESALTHFEQALQLDPADANAKKNHDITKQLIEQLKEQQKQQQQQQEQKDQKQDKKDQKDQKKEQSKEEQQKQDQQQSGDQKQDQNQGQGQEEKQQSEGEKQDQDQKGEKGEQEKQQDAKDEKQEKGEKKQQSQDGRSEQQQGKDGEQPGQEEMSEQQNRKLEGELKNNPVSGEESKESQEQKEAAEQELAAAEGRMTEAQAKALLDSLKDEDRRVRLLDPQGRRQRDRTLRDW